MPVVAEDVVVGERIGGRMGELYREHAPDASRLAYLLTGNKQAAEDLVQEAFVRMFGRFRDLRQPDSFGGYLRTTVVNLARSQFRRARRERTYLADQRIEVATQPETADRHTMWTALQQLPHRQRAAIVLRYYEDLTEAQTADVLRCAKGTVKSLTSRGLERLRKELGTDE